MGDGLRRRRAHLRQLRGRGGAIAALRRPCRPLRFAAAARALSIPARGLSRRDLVSQRACRLAADAQTQPLPADRTAVAAARRGRLPGDAGRNGLNLRPRDATNMGRISRRWFMQIPRLSGWQIVTLITALAAVIATAAVALILGKEALIAIAVILVIAVVVLGYY